MDSLLWEIIGIEIGIAIEIETCPSTNLFDPDPNPDFDFDFDIEEYCL
jgi:hypothetical protein